MKKKIAIIVAALIIAFASVKAYDNYTTDNNLYNGGTLTEIIVTPNGNSFAE